MILASVSWTAPQEKCRQDHDYQERINENVILPEESKEIKIFNLHPENLPNGWEASVVGKGIGTELNDW
jgi:hypothetical protein